NTFTLLPTPPALDLPFTTLAFLRRCSNSSCNRASCSSSSTSSASCNSSSSGCGCSGSSSSGGGGGGVHEILEAAAPRPPPAAVRSHQPLVLPLPLPRPLALLLLLTALLRLFLALHCRLACCFLLTVCLLPLLPALSLLRLAPMICPPILISTLSLLRLAPTSCIRPAVLLIPPVYLLRLVLACRSLLLLLNPGTVTVIAATAHTITTTGTIRTISATSICALSLHAISLHPTDQPLLRCPIRAI
ncbi:unnamed protein product, partial [Closterium sp. NIES-53]